MDNLLARFAENAFWIARYVERADNLARILDVNETFARNNDGEQDWLPIVQLHSDEEHFFERNKEATADSVIFFYILDRNNTSSLISLVRIARENAREIRHLLSTEMWTHINVFYNRLSAMSQRQLTLSRLSGICASIKLDCQLHTGIVEGTLYRDQLWRFYQIGRSIERADMATRFLDIKYHRILPSLSDVGTPVDISEWNALLRSVAGYHAYLRVTPKGMGLESIASFLLFNTRFPRSLAAAVNHVHDHLNSLRAFESLQHVEVPMKTIATLFGIIKTYDTTTVVNEGMHEFLDRIQALLIDFTDELGCTYFGHQQ
ncbi:MAG: alpha-E domain-containing protein [Rhodospirillales bacterium]